MTEAQYQELAERTLTAQTENREIPMLTKEYPELTRREGYHIQALREQLVLGQGHRLVGYKMGATSLAKRRQMGSKMPSYAVNQVGGTALGGAMDNGLNPTTTLGCGTWGNNIISENLWYTHLMNVSRISYRVPDMYVPTDEEIWAD